MHFQYFVWKYPVKDVNNPEWVELTGTEFYALVKEENEKPQKTRFFKIIDDGIEQGMEPYILETTKERYVEWNKEFCAKYRRRKMQQKYNRMIVSMDANIDEDAELTYHDVIPDDDVSVEERVERNLLIEELHRVLRTLSGEDLKILDMLFFNNNEGLSERKIARANGIDPGTLRYQRTNILKKIKKSFTQN